MANHKDLPNTELHEPKGIPVATTADAGKVITPSDTTAGTSVLRKLSMADLSDGPTLDNIGAGGYATTDSGMVLTPSATTAGETVVRYLVKAEVGLANVDNTADSAKPVSTAQAAADAVVLSSAQTYTDGRLSAAQRTAIDALVSPVSDYADLTAATAAIKSIIDALKA